MNRWIRPGSLLLLAALLGGCVNATTDQQVFNTPEAGIGEASVVILGRRHASDYETEPDFISCVGQHISRRDDAIEIIDEITFMNALYPWFEPRTAPLRPQDIERLLSEPPVAARLAELKTEYMIWIDGRTERTDSAGSMSCGVGPGGAGCFGFGTWSSESIYEATIWDFKRRAEVGRISTSASGQSYMPAVVVPIPIIAPVQGTACDSIGDQLLQFLSAQY
ncbi:MAG: hypothetical protein CME38_06100 [Haliea sp.]|nr:hypothetical protein [Haliea sp.]